jgi:uncharacterized membrane protein
MMFLWIPFMFVAVLAAWWMLREDGYAPSRGMSHTMPTAPYGMSPAGQPDPIEIVRQRLARGEITAEEYATVLRALR